MTQTTAKGSPVDPVFAISVRQPWAWLIVNGYKDIENRDWTTNRRGPVFIHASQNTDPDEWEAAIGTVLEIDPGILTKLPSFENIERGGIVGRVNIVDCVPESHSPWFFGDFGFVLAEGAPLPFQPCRGALKFFIPRLG